jgi:DNA-binding GntR family transcriptional regulator
VVRDFSPREIEDLYCVRSVLERAVAPLIVERIGPAALRALRTLNRRFEEACRRREMAAMIGTNIAFHRRMWTVSGNAFLCQPLDISRLQTNRIRYMVWMSQERVEESIRDHREMIAALARKEAATFEAALFRRVAGGKGDYQQIFPIGAPEDARRSPGQNGSGQRRASTRRKEAAHA